MGSWKCQFTHILLTRKDRKRFSGNQFIIWGRGINEMGWAHGKDRTLILSNFLTFKGDWLWSMIWTFFTHHIMYVAIYRLGPINMLERCNSTFIGYLFNVRWHIGNNKETYWEFNLYLAQVQWHGITHIIILQNLFSLDRAYKSRQHHPFDNLVEWRKVGIINLALSLHRIFSWYLQYLINTCN